MESLIFRFRAVKISRGGLLLQYRPKFLRRAKDGAMIAVAITAEDGGYARKASVRQALCVPVPMTGKGGRGAFRVSDPMLI